MSTPAMTDRSQIPRPAPNPELYQRILQEGFRAFPERKKNYEKYQSAKRGERADFLPIKLDIENVSRCNFHCTMCQVSDWPKFQRAPDMTLEDYQNLILEQIGLIEVKLQGMGEPLLGPHFFDMVAFARKRHIWVRTSTNGSLFHLKENYKRLVDSDISEVSVSIDGATAATYEKIRRGGKFETVSKNCILLNQYSEQTKWNRIKMCTVVQKDNFHELELFPKLARELGFHDLVLSLDLNDWGQDRWRETNRPLDFHQSMNLPMIESLIRIGSENGVRVTFWFIDEKYHTDSPDHLCPWPFERSYISSDMRIVPCCMMANPEVMDLGDAKRLSEDWNGEKVIEFRKMHLKGKIPSVCKTCYRN